MLKGYMVRKRLVTPGLESTVSNGLKWKTSYNAIYIAKVSVECRDRWLM